MFWAKASLVTAATHILPSFTSKSQTALQKTENGIISITEVEKLRHRKANTHVDNDTKEQQWN